MTLVWTRQLEALNTVVHSWKCLWKQVSRAAHIAVRQRDVRPTSTNPSPKLAGLSNHRNRSLQKVT